MYFRRCENCGSLYKAEIKGRLSILCRCCAMDCDEAFPRILNFLHKNKLYGKNDTYGQYFILDLDRITNETGISTTLLLVLTHEGKFGNRIEMLHDLSPFSRMMNQTECLSS